MAIRSLHPQKSERRFVWRGREPTRVEALSDMVFAFALTMLVMSCDPPASFGELRDQLWGFPGFAVAFALLLLIWHSHYLFFRRFALADGWTTALNAALLFLIVFFIYPLKFLVTMLSHFIRQVLTGQAAPSFTLLEARDALMMLSAGYGALFLVFALLYAHALRRAGPLALDADEVWLTRFSFWQQAVHCGVAALVVGVAALAPTPIAPFSGFLFLLIGPLIFLAAALLRRNAPAAVPSA
jgi:hypothetical protein